MVYIQILAALGIILGLLSFLKKKNVVEKKHRNVSLLKAHELKRILENDTDIQLVDVRTAFEFKQEKISTAKNIDYMSRNFIDKFKTYDKSKSLYIYCRSGARSAKAANALAKEGFIRVYDLDGGIVEWKKSK